MLEDQRRSVSTGCVDVIVGGDERGVERVESLKSRRWENHFASLSVERCNDRRRRLRSIQRSFVKHACGNVGANLNGA